MKVRFIFPSILTVWLLAAVHVFGIYIGVISKNYTNDHTCDFILIETPVISLAGTVYGIVVLWLLGRIIVNVKIIARHHKRYIQRNSIGIQTYVSTDTLNTFSVSSHLPNQIVRPPSQIQRPTIGTR